MPRAAHTPTGGGVHRGKAALSVCTGAPLACSPLHTSPRVPDSQPFVHLLSASQFPTHKTPGSRDFQRTQNSPERDVPWHPGLSCSGLRIRSPSPQPFLHWDNTCTPKSRDDQAEQGGRAGEAPERSPWDDHHDHIQRETSVPNHIIWSLFHTTVQNVCCLGCVAFAYSVKVGGVREFPEGPVTLSTCPEGTWGWGAGVRCVYAGGGRWGRVWQRDRPGTLQRGVQGTAGSTCTSSPQVPLHSPDERLHPSRCASSPQDSCRRRERYSKDTDPGWGEWPVKVPERGMVRPQASRTAECL